MFVFHGDVGAFYSSSNRENLINYGSVKRIFVVVVLNVKVVVVFCFNDRQICLITFGGSSSTSKAGINLSYCARSFFSARIKFFCRKKLFFKRFNFSLSRATFFLLAGKRTEIIIKATYVYQLKIPENVREKNEK